MVRETMAETSATPMSPAQERIASFVIRGMTALNTWVYRATGGRLGSKFLRGAPVCLITTVGRKTGRKRTVALIYLEDGDDVILVASKGGMTHHPQWFLNMEANPQVWVEIGTTVTPMLARRASDEEKAAYWPRLLEIYPDYADYQARTTRNIPVLILSPGSAEA